MKYRLVALLAMVIALAVAYVLSGESGSAPLASPTDSGGGISIQQ